MKRITLFASALLLLLGTTLLSLPTTVFAEGANLIANNTVEAGTTAPSNWSQSRWGTNTATLSYITRTASNKALRVDMTARTDGDAKWMHDAANIAPTTSYTYSSWYRSNTATEIDLQYTDTAGNVSYAYVASVPAHSTGTTLTYTFVTPASAAKVSVMHIIAGPGYLETDDFNLTPTPTAPIDQDNLILNGSFETANVGSPVNWSKNAWGTNTAAFSYETAGRTGTRSAKVTMSAYTSGDAKWYADASAVTAGKSYTYRDYYKSTVATRVVLAFQNTAGAYTYQEVAGAPASTAWAEYSATFTVPAGLTNVSVYHVISSVGTLTIDDASLYVALPATTEPVVPNASLETANGSAPAKWSPSKWGNNTANYQYMNEGRTGSKSVKVTVSNYVDGDAKWYFEPITTLQPGSQYRFTTYYKTNATTPHAVAMFIMNDGTERYMSMPNAQPAANASTTWQKYSDTFSVPAGAVSASAFLFIAQNGWLQTDDYSLSSYSPNGFSRALLTMTFDDGHEENATTALPILNKYGLKTTQCFATSFIEGQSQSVKNGVLAFKNSGHEICSHTVTHPFLTTTTGTNLTYELQHSQSYLKSLTGQAVTNFASPYGDYDVRVINEIKKYYRSHRSVDEGYNSKDNFNIYSLRVQNILDTTTAAQITEWIHQAQTDRTWLILVYHRVADDPGPYDTYKSAFAGQVQAIKSSGITVKTYNDALNELTPQLP